MSLKIYDADRVKRDVKTTISSSGGDAIHIPHHKSEITYANSSSIRTLTYSNANLTASVPVNLSASSLIVTNMTDANMFILVGASDVSSQKFSYLVFSSGAYESVVKNSQLAHSIVTDNAGSGLVTITTTYEN